MREKADPWFVTTSRPSRRERSATWSSSPYDATSIAHHTGERVTRAMRGSSSDAGKMTVHDCLGLSGATSAQVAPTMSPDSSDDRRVSDSQ